jgi:hypothetical protein
MKWMSVIVVLAIAGFISTKGAAAHSPQEGHYQTVQYAGPPVPVMTICNVNGVDYQVDYGYRIWGVNNIGQWFVIGRIVSTPNGPIGVRNDGMRFPASCQ